ncbi:MAG TPA: Na-translocating system protein MpsC family protein, partial [Solirubrobacteraceae bacterium]|nr:Na-translocating system protein MpsC family protein [Solirubrobacteraceae bacterium]
VGEVQRLTARTVVGYHSQVLVDQGVAVEIFVLDAPVAGDGDEERQRGGPGPLRAAIGNAVGKALYDLYGRGPARTRVYLADDVVLCALEDPLTTVEQTLAEGGRTDLVRRLRRGFVRASAARLEADVQALVERPVVACQSQVVFDPDILFLTFLLAAR